MANYSAAHKAILNEGGRVGESYYDTWKRKQKAKEKARLDEKKANEQADKKPVSWMNERSYPGSGHSKKTFKHQTLYDKWKAERDNERHKGLSPKKDYIMVEQHGIIPGSATEENPGGTHRKPIMKEVNARPVGAPKHGPYGGARENAWFSNREEFRKADKTGWFKQQGLSNEDRELGRKDMNALHEKIAEREEKAERQRLRDERVAFEDQENKEIGADPNVYDGPLAGDQWDREREENIESLRDQRRKRWTQEYLASGDRWSEEDRLEAQRDPNHPWPTMYDREKYDRGRGDLIDERREFGGIYGEEGFLQNAYGDVNTRDREARQARDRGINEAIDGWTEYDNRQVRQSADEGVAADITADSAGNFLLDYEGNWNPDANTHQATRNRGVEDDSYDPPDSGGHDLGQRQLADPQAPATGLSGAEEWKDQADTAHREKISSGINEVRAAGDAGHLPRHVVDSMVKELRSGRPSAIKNVMGRLHELGVIEGWMDPARTPREGDGNPFSSIRRPGALGEGRTTPVIPSHGRYGA